MLRADLKWKLVTGLLGTCLVVGIAIGISSCQQSVQTSADLAAMTSRSALTTTDGPLSEVNIPASISQLAPSLAKFQPQVRILSPQPDETLTDDRVTVSLAVTDLPLFKQPELGLGNHLHLILDKQTYQGVYDLSQPLVFKNLAAGTHSLRVFASRPWHESFKNAGAYAQVSFNVLTKTAEHNPDPSQPLLTYSRPTGTYGAEPIMLDYYLTNVSTNLDEQGLGNNESDWRIRVTVNDQRFILDKWAPVYLRGFKPGKNWVRMELLDDRGEPIPNVYNDTVGIVTYDPQSQDPLSQLIRGEIDPILARSLVDPSYVAIKPTPTPVPIPVPIIPPAPAPTSIPVPIIGSNPVVKPSPNPSEIVPVPVAKPVPEPIAIVPAPTIAETPSIPTPAPITTLKPTLKPTVQPAPIPAPVLSNPVPVPELQPAIPAPTVVPVPIPAPEVVKTPPVAPTPQPIPALTPQPVPLVVPVPKIEPEVAIKNSPVVDRPAAPPQPSPPPQQIVPLPAPSIEPPQVSPPAVTTTTPAPVKTWQMQADDLRKAAGVKIRAFTNTIPAKAQRFGHNVQIWVSNAINQIQAWRAAHVD